jgi:hypothetical protein
MPTTHSLSTQIIAGVLVFLGLLAALPLFALYHAWVFRDLWSWFVVPLGVRPLTIWHAWGLIIVAGLLRGHAQKSPKDYDKSEFWGMMLLGPLVAWLIGALVARML